MSIIYHITTKKEWEQAKTQGYYRASSLETEGFIHCSEEAQVKGVLERYYKGRQGLVKLHIDTSRLIHPLKYELAPSVNEKFPHVYGDINTSAVVKEEKI